MIQIRTFLTSELPYDKLRQLRLSKERMLKEPTKVMDRLQKGNLSPLMRFNYTDKSGKTKTVVFKLQLHRNGDGMVGVRVFPKQKDYQQGDTYHRFQLRRYEEDALKRGEVITKEMMKNGKRGISFIQLDKDTNHLIYTNVKNLVVPNSLNNVELSLEQKKRIRDGKPVELAVGNTKITAGVDLQTIQGFKVIKGDLNEWKQQKEMKWDAANPDKMGFLQTDENRAEYQESLDKKQGRKPISEKKSKMKL